MDELYREVILDHYKNPRNFGKLKNPTHSAHKSNPLCGDDITIQLSVSKDGKTVHNIAFSGMGCAICMASASMLTQQAIHEQIRVLKRLKKDDIVNTLKVELSPARLKCALLPLEVLHEALDQH